MQICNLCVLCWHKIMVGNRDISILVGEFPSDWVVVNSLPFFGHSYCHSWCICSSTLQLVLLLCMQLLIFCGLFQISCTFGFFWFLTLRCLHFPFIYHLQVMCKTSVNSRLYHDLKKWILFPSVTSSCSSHCPTFTAVVGTGDAQIGVPDMRNDSVSCSSSSLLLSFQDSQSSSDTWLF